MTVTPFIDVEFIVADLLDGEEFPLDSSGTNNVTFAMGENLFGGTVEPPDAADGEREDLLAIFVKRAGEFEIAEQFCGGGSHYNGRLQIYLRGRPEQKQQTEYLARHVERFLNSQQGIDVPGIMRFYSTSPMAAQSVTQEGSAVCPLYVFTFMIQIDDRFTGASVPSTGVPASGDLDGFFLAPDVVAGHFGGTRLTFGAIDDGQYVQRVGTEIVGVDLDFVPSSRTISTTSPLQGGGDLSTNRTISLADSGVTAAVYGDGANIPVVTVTAKGLISLASEAPVTVAHINAGGDLGGTLDAPTVDAVHSSGTRLTIGTITDGQVLVRSGTTISSTGAIVPSTRTITGTAPITVNGISGSGQALSSDLTVAHAASGATAGSYGSKSSPLRITIDAQGHVTSAQDVRVLDHTVMWRSLTTYSQWSTSNLGAVVEDTPVSGSIADTQLNSFVGSANTTSVKRLGSTPSRLRWDGSTRGYVSIWVLCPVALPSTGNTLVTWGLMNAQPSGTTLPASGCYFAFLSTTSGTKVLCVTANAGTTTVTITNVDFSLNVMREYQIQLAKDRSTVVFIIDGVTVAEHSSNFPATSALLTQMQTELRTAAVAASLGIALGVATLIATL